MKELILTSPQAMMTTDTARASSIGTLIERDPLLTTMPNVVRIGYYPHEEELDSSTWDIKTTV